MKRHHLFGFYATFLIPGCVLLGAALGNEIGGQTLLIVFGVVLGLAASGLALRFSPRGEGT